MELLWLSEGAEKKEALFEGEENLLLAFIEHAVNSYRVGS